MEQHAVVSPQDWLAARRALLLKEKEFTRARDELSRQRLALPWVKVEKTYVFDGPDGKRTLADLFDGRSQLFIQHFMFGPEWKEGCTGCSFQADHIEGALVHLEHHDVSLVVVSRGPLAQIEAFRKRMGWRFKWVSSFGSDFNYDYHVSFTPEQIAEGKAEYNYETIKNKMDELAGCSVFYKDEAGDIFHTYSAYARGDETLIGTYMYLDMMPKGRNETGSGNLMDWVKHHDRYDDARPAAGGDTCCGAE